MRKLIVSEFLSLDGVMQAPGGADEDTEGGFQHGSWTLPFWHDDIGAAFGALMKDTDAFLLGRKPYLIHGAAFEPMPAGDFFGDTMNAPAKYVVSETLEKPIWRNTTILRDNLVDEIKKIKAAPGKNILTDGSHELVHLLFQHDLVDERVSGGTEARTGLRMMPTFPPSPLKFRTAGFPQYGFKASLSTSAFPCKAPVKPAPGIPFAPLGLHPAFAPHSERIAPLL